MKKNIGVVIGLVAVAAVILLVVFGNVRKKANDGSFAKEGTEKENSEASILANKNLTHTYPGNIAEVVKLYQRYLKCFYNDTYTEKQFNDMFDEFRLLFDEETFCEENPKDIQKNSLRSAVKTFKTEKKIISVTQCQRDSEAIRSTKDGENLATLVCYSLTTQPSKNKNYQVYEKIYLKQDKYGHWKIMGNEKTTPVDF